MILLWLILMHTLIGHRCNLMFDIYFLWSSWQTLVLVNATIKLYYVMLEEACKIKACMDIFKNLLLRILIESGRDKMSTIIWVHVLYWQLLGIWNVSNYIYSKVWPRNFLEDCLSQYRADCASEGCLSHR